MSLARRAISSVWTRQELLEARALWKKAYLAAASGQSYTIDGRSLTRQDIDDIVAQLDYIQKELDKLDGSGGGPIFVSGRPRR